MLNARNMLNVIFEKVMTVGRGKYLKATNIEWDCDEEDRNFLPTEIDIPSGMRDEEEISDYLSDVTGYCHRGFTLG